MHATVYLLTYRRIFNQILSLYIYLKVKNKNKIEIVKGFNSDFIWTDNFWLNDRKLCKNQQCHVHAILSEHL